METDKVTHEHEARIIVGAYRVECRCGWHASSSEGQYGVLHDAFAGHLQATRV